jgi:hypothetical protein
MSADAFARFQDAVLADPALQDELLAIDDADTFAARVVTIAAERSIAVDEDDVLGALLAGDRRWIEHWL